MTDVVVPVAAMSDDRVVPTEAAAPAAPITTAGVAASLLVVAIGLVVGAVGWVLVQSSVPTLLWWFLIGGAPFAAIGTLGLISALGDRPTDLVGARRMVDEAAGSAPTSRRGSR